MGAFDYFKTLWEDSPSHDTPISADNLNKIENGVKQANDGLAALPGVYAPVGTTPPDHTRTLIWIDTSALPPTLRYWDGTQWTAFGGSVADLVAALNGVSTLALSGSGVTDTGGGQFAITSSSASPTGGGQLSLTTAA